MTHTAIQLENLSKSFGRGQQRKDALQNLNLSIEAGQVYGFLGPNGAGKSTTIRILLNLMYPSIGQALIFGRNPQHDPAILRRVGALVEGASFYPYLSGWDNLSVIGNSQGKFDPPRAQQLLNLLDLHHAAHQRFKHYSTGMKQRLGIAAALLNNPELIILDEPTNGMDPAGIREMRTFIRDLAHKFGKTVFLTSHLLAEIQQICDRVAIINHGRIIQEGLISDLLAPNTQLNLDLAQPDQALPILQANWVAQLVDDGLIRITATRTDTPHIIRLLVDNNIDIYSIIPHRQSLEEYFLNLIEEKVS